MEQIWHEGKRRLGMQLLVHEGMFSSIMYSMTSAFLVAFALALGANVIYIGLLTSIPNVFWTLALVPAAVVTQKYMFRRKALLVGATALSRAMWFGILMLPLALSGWSLTGLLLFVVLSSAIGAFATPAWASLVGDIVPADVRGRYFSRRLVWTVIAGLSTQLIAGWVLDAFGKGNSFGFVIIFATGLLAGLLSATLIWKVPEPPAGIDSRVRATSSMREVLKDKRFRRFLLLFGLFEFSVMIASPFFNVQLLQVLRADYIWISILAVAGGLAGIVVQRGWGRISDRYGHRAIVIVSAFWIVLVPLLWIPVQPEHLAWLIAVEAFSGAVWAGFTLAHFNYMLELSPSAARPTYAAMFNIVIGIAGIAGPLAGGLIAEAFSTAPLLGLAGMTDMRALFLVSGALRAAAAILFAIFLFEVVEKRERVSPTHIFGEVMKSGILGGILKAHNAAGTVSTDASTVKDGLKGAAKVAKKDAKNVAHVFGEAVEKVITEADRLGDKISESGIAWPQVEKESEKKKVGKKLRVKVSV